MYSIVNWCKQSKSKSTNIERNFGVEQRTMQTIVTWKDRQMILKWVFHARIFSGYSHDYNWYQYTSMNQSCWDTKRKYERESHTTFIKAWSPLINLSVNGFLSCMISPWIWRNWTYWIKNWWLRLATFRRACWKVWTQPTSHSGSAHFYMCLFKILISPQRIY